MQIEQKSIHEDIADCGLMWSPVRTIQTKNGPREIVTAQPTSDFWNLWRVEKEEVRAAGYSVSKYQGDWVVTRWGAPDETKIEETEPEPETDYSEFAKKIRLPRGKTLLNYQIDGCAKLIAQDGTGLLADEMGLGKTVQAICAINSLPSMDKILIVCPASLKLNWKSELENWLTDLDRTIFIPVNGTKWPSTDRKIIIINYEQLRKYRDEIRKIRWDFLICDEAQKIKNPQAQRTKEVIGSSKKNISRIPARRRLHVTGTPILSRPVEIWPLLQDIFNGDFDTYYQFVRRYCDAQQGRFGLDVSGASNLMELHSRLQKIMIRRLKRDVLQDLPPKTRQIIALDKNANPALRSAVSQEIYVLGSLAGKPKLAQLSEIAKIRHETALKKIPATIDHVANLLESVDHVVVFGHHQDVIQGIVSGLRDQKINAQGMTGETTQVERQNLVSDFQQGKIQVLVCSLGVAGTGLTLTKAQNIVIVELPWTPGELIQAEDRAHRIGQRDNVLVQFLVVQGSIDHAMAKLLSSKAAIVDAAIDGKFDQVGGEITYSEIVDEMGG